MKRNRNPEFSPYCREVFAPAFVVDDHSFRTTNFLLNRNHHIGGDLYCNNCGAANSDQGKWCSNCGKELSTSAQTPTPPLPPGYPPPQSGPRVESYLVHSILVTVFCCLPFGIPAIVYAARVNNKLAVGDVNGAMEASGQAKTWCWIALIAGLVFGFGWVGLSFLGMLGNLH